MLRLVSKLDIRTCLTGNSREGGDVTLFEDDRALWVGFLPLNDGWEFVLVI